MNILQEDKVLIFELRQSFHLYRMHALFQGFTVVLVAKQPLEISVSVCLSVGRPKTQKKRSYTSNKLKKNIVNYKTIEKC